MSIAKYHGEVSKCHCGIADNPEKIGERACKQCLSRGFVAKCKGCDGKGETTQKMAGGPGSHTATCNFCGGSGLFAVNKPADWAEPVKEEAKEEVAVA